MIDMEQIETTVERQLRIAGEKMSEQTEQMQFEMAAQTREFKKITEAQMKKLYGIVEDEIIQRLDAIYNENKLLNDNISKLEKKLDKLIKASKTEQGGK